MQEQDIIYMSKPVAFLFSFLFFAITAWSQVLPKEGSNLNYRLIGFSFPATGQTGTYVIEIATGIFDNEPAFRTAIFKSIICNTGKTIVEVPSFGSAYTWHTVYKNSKDETVISELHHFKTMSNINVDTTVNHLRIISNNEKYTDAHIFLDCTQSLYDMQGNPVWFYPDNENPVNGNSNLRDMKLTNDGTITFLKGDKAYEVNYNGDNIWKGPNSREVSPEKSEHYHHEFTKLKNGHYMVLGTQNVSWKIPLYVADSAHPATDASVTRGSDNGYMKTLQFGTVIEYDQKGNIVWSWKSEEYFKKCDLFQHNLPNGQFEYPDVHENAFYFDESGGNIYIGFRDISRILKVKYPSGKVLAEYGEKYKSGTTELVNYAYCGQHSIFKSKTGELLVFNNNSTAPSALPKLEILKEPLNGKGDLKKVWEYNCNLDGINENERVNHDKKLAHFMAPRDKSKLSKFTMSSGGAFYELPDGAFFASMSSPYSKILLLNRNKTIDWCAMPEKWNPTDSTWKALPVYRSHIINDQKKLEKLIWNTELQSK